MRRPRVTVNATVFAAAIRIHARVETDVGAVVVRDDRAAEIPIILRGELRPIFVREIFQVGFQRECFETISGISRCAAAVNRKRRRRRHQRFESVVAVHGDMFV